ncbi:MAG: hypothetical protein HY907_04940 [Deltaproteobacteria bacterium]|nr:hypothetical protein [Deltaproteobacteria bacterium]
MRRVWVLVAAVIAAVALLGGCKKIFGRPKLNPDRGPLGGDTEVSIYVPDCGDHSKVKEVLFGGAKQEIVGLRDDEVKIRTRSVQDEQTVPVILILPNQSRCETGANFIYQKLESSGVGAIFERGVTLGESRAGGFRPDQREE